jgi:hypothetical protein
MELTLIFIATTATAVVLYPFLRSWIIAGENQMNSDANNAIEPF